APYSGTGNNAGLSAGSYNYTVTDANGCTASASATITEPTVLTVGVVASNYNGYGVSCFQSTDGSADATANGGVGGYSYSWSNGSTSEDLSGLAAGSYSVTVTDANGCTAGETVVLAEPTKVNISATNTAIACNGGNSDVTVTTWGGVNPYIVDEAGVYSVPAGTYTYNVEDANGCSASTTIDITQPALLTVDAGSDETVFLGYGPMQCADLNATVNGGTPAYSVVWTSTASGGGVGSAYTACPTSNESYTVSVVDANGCTASDQLSICVVDVTCYAGNSSIQKVEMCQIPPGNPANAHTICVDANAVPAHLAIGCQLGACGELAAACSGPAAKNMEADLLSAALTAYPNPTENTTTISVTLTKAGNYSVEMYDMMGKLVKTVYAGSFEEYENLEFDVDMTNLNTGVYMISVSNGDQKIENIRVMKN
ncbi:MAG: T9SS type A sorting domain-containing protein, partial [Flavobacteriia bacterium]